MAKVDKKEKKKKKIVKYGPTKKDKRGKEPIVATYDEAARTEYVTGFSKRKKEKKKTAQLKIINMIKEEKREKERDKRNLQKDLLRQVEMIESAVKPKAPIMVSEETKGRQLVTVTISEIEELDEFKKMEKIEKMIKPSQDQGSEEGSDSD